MRALTQQLLDGTLALATWELLMMQQIKQTHLVALAVAHGGWTQLDQADFGWVGAQIKPQYQYLAKFSVEVSTGAQKLDGTVLARAALYAAAARATHREAQRRLAAERAAGEERRRLGIADHCRTCLQQAKLSWQPFGSLRRIGDSECRVACRCWFEFRPAA